MFPWNRVREEVLQQVKKLPRPFNADDVLSIYRMTHFSDLPFEKLGFRSIHDFLASFPNFVAVYTPEGICYNVVKIDTPPSGDNEKEDGECDTDDEGEEPLRFNGGDEVLTRKVGTLKKENPHDYVEILSVTNAVVAPSDNTTVVSNTSPGSVENLVAPAAQEPAETSESVEVVEQPATVIDRPASEEDQVSAVADSQRSTGSLSSDVQLGASGAVSDSEVHAAVDEPQGEQEAAENEVAQAECGTGESQAVVVATSRRSSSLFQSVSGYIKGCLGLLPSKNANSSSGKQLQGNPNPPSGEDPADASALSSSELEKMTIEDILAVRFASAIYENMAVKGKLDKKALASIVNAYPPFSQTLGEGGTAFVKRINQRSRLKLRQLSGNPLIVGSAYEKGIPPEIADYVRAVFEEDQRRLDVIREKFVPLIPEVGSVPHTMLMKKYLKKYGIVLDDVERQKLTGCKKLSQFFHRLMDEENPKLIKLLKSQQASYARSSKERWAAAERTKQALIDFNRGNKSKKEISEARNKMWSDFEKNFLSLPPCDSEHVPVDAIPLPPGPAVLPSQPPAVPTVSKVLRKCHLRPVTLSENTLKRMAAPPTASDEPTVGGNGVPLIYTDEYKKLEKEILDMATFPSAEILTFDEILLMKAAIHLILILDTDGGTTSFPSPITEDVRLHLTTKIVMKKYGVDDFIKKTVGTPFEIEKVCGRPLALRNVNYSKMTQAIAEFAAAILLEDDKRLDDAREQFLELLPPHPGSMSFSAVSSVYSTRFHRELDASERKLISGVEDEATFLLRLEGDNPHGKLVAFVRDDQWYLMIGATSKTHPPRKLESNLTEAKRRIAYTLKLNYPITFDRLNEAHTVKYKISLDENERRRCCGYGSIIVFLERIRTERIYGEILYARRGHKFYLEKPKKPRECMPPSPKRKRVEEGGQNQQQVTESAATADPTPAEPMEVVAPGEAVPEQESPVQPVDTIKDADEDSSVLITGVVRRRRAAAAARVKNEEEENPHEPIILPPPPPSPAAVVVARDEQGAPAAEERPLTTDVNPTNPAVVVEGEQPEPTVEERLQPATEQPADCAAVANGVGQRLEDGGHVAGLVNNNSGEKGDRRVAGKLPGIAASEAALGIKKQQDGQADEKFVLIGQMVTMVLREAHQRGEDTDAIILRTFNALYGK